KALTIAKVGVAMLCRNAWVESVDRYERLFLPHPPQIIAPFVERVPMVKGRWDPSATTATAYSWFVWWHRPCRAEPTVVWIPPGQRRRLTRDDDVRRFCAPSSVPL